MSDLREQANREALRMSTVLLAFAASAIGFGIHEVSGWAPGWSLVPASLAAIAWGASFSGGVLYSHSVQRALQANIAIHDSKTAEQRARAQAAFNLAVRSTTRRYRWQLWGLLAGAMLYVGAVGGHMAEKAVDRPLVAAPGR